MTKIEMTIQNKLTGEKKDFEIKSRTQPTAMMKLMANIRKYANKDWKITDFASDSPVINNYIEEHKPDVSTRLI